MHEHFRTKQHRNIKILCLFSASDRHGANETLVLQWGGGGTQKTHTTGPLWGDRLKSVMTLIASLNNKKLTMNVQSLQTQGASKGG